MAPPWVLLKRKVYFEHDASAFGGASEKAGGESTIYGDSGTVRGVPSRQDRRDAIVAYLRTLKPDAHFANPPELSSLRILRPTESIPHMCGGIISACIASADKNLVALYAGPYRPGTDLKGGYLIYDASKNSLSTIPQPPYDYSRAEVGRVAAAVLCLDGGADYVLGELTSVRDSEPPEAALCTWRASSAEWTVKVASFPPELCPPDLSYVFQADMCFSYRGSILCWVDLFRGMVICDLTLHIDGQPEFRFIPLPRECVTYDRFERPLRAEQFRSMACVGGSIKFVTMDGYGQRPGPELSMTIWTLSADLCAWNKGREYPVRDIWATEAYLSLGLPNILPSLPVLSMDEDGVVCLVLTHWNVSVDMINVEYRSQYLLRVDMQHNKVSQCPTNTEQLHSQLFSTECRAYFSA